MLLASHVHRLAELRKRQHTTQVTQARVSRIEKGQLERSEVDTLGVCQGARRQVEDRRCFGDETYVLG
jgi:hypothetical protein